MAQKTSKHQGLPETLALVFAEYVNRHDPLKKAERARARKDAMPAENSETRASVNNVNEQLDPKVSARAEKPFARTPLTAAEKHAVDLRDQRRCTHVDVNGKRCGEGRWIHYHHIHRVAEGGSNHPDNLTTLCSFHHDLIHQQVFPLEGEMSWLRSPVRPYGDVAQP